MLVPVHLPIFSLGVFYIHADNPSLEYRLNILPAFSNDKVIFSFFEYFVYGPFDFLLMKKMGFSSPSIKKTALTTTFNAAKYMLMVCPTDGLDKTSHTKYSFMS